MINNFWPTVILLFMVMDSLGNLPVFVATLDHLTPRRYVAVVLRESLIALGILGAFLLCGEQILALLHISQASLELAGGIVLFLIALNMIFGPPAKTPNAPPEREPLVVPLAIPLIAGPASMSSCILIGGSPGMPFILSAVALILAWSGGTALLLAGRYARNFVGPKALSALETLAGLVLAAMAVEMAVRGIRSAFKLG